jgi:hypothetical protein
MKAGSRFVTHSIKGRDRGSISASIGSPEGNGGWPCRRRNAVAVTHRLDQGDVIEPQVAPMPAGSLEAVANRPAQF